MPTTHNLKTWPPYFDTIARGDKNFEVRKNDRAFQAGDTLILEYFDPAEQRHEYGHTIGLQRRISFVLPGGQFGVEPGYCVLGLVDDAPKSSGSEL
jgi:hypothetical protein